MTLAELQQRLHQIGWHEQLEHQLPERSPSISPPNATAIEAELRALAEAVDLPLLDLLEAQEGYLVWALRLSPFVDPAGAGRRAQRYVEDANWRVRHWARVISGAKRS
jgi:hypothetical protein